MMEKQPNRIKLNHKGKPYIDDILDHGYVIMWETLGDDLTPVNAAKVSYDKRSDKYGKREAGLTRFLAEEEHTSPFRHGVLQFESYAPLMVARQWWKYIIGSQHQEFDTMQDPFTAWNESSRRYITEKPEFYLPQSHEWRSAPDNSKQGSGPVLSYKIGEKLTQMLLEHQEDGQTKYELAMELGACAEQARLFLPAYGLYVRWYWTASLQGVSHFLNQRLEHDAQKEIQVFAEAIKELTETKFSNSLSELLKYK